MEDKPQQGWRIRVEKPKTLDWKWAAVCAAAFVLLRDLYTKDSLCTAELIAFFLLSVAFPALLISTLEIHTMELKEKPVMRFISFGIWYASAGLLALAIAIGALMWSKHWGACLLFAATLQTGLIWSWTSATDDDERS